MWNRHNVHKIFINIYRNPKTRNWFRYETFIHLFEFKGFSTWGERDTIFLRWLLLHRQLSTQPTHGARSAPDQSWVRQDECLASPSSAISTFPFGRRNSTNWLFPNLKILSTHFRAWRHSPPKSFPIWGFILTSVNDASSPRAREHLRSCLHLTNPYTEPKGSHAN